MSVWLLMPGALSECSKLYRAGCCLARWTWTLSLLRVTQSPGHRSFMDIPVGGFWAVSHFHR